MSKTARQKRKLEANAMIRLELKKRGIKYRDMQQAVADLAQSAGLEVYSHSLDAREFLCKALSLTSVRSSLKFKKAVAGTAPYKPTPFDVERVARVTSPSEVIIKKFYASWEWKRLSYEVKLERGRVCECCGARPPQAVIVTDHIRPLRKHWLLRLDKNNMQVLCDDCNRGKSSRDETDFRGRFDDIVLTVLDGGKS